MEYYSDIKLSNDMMYLNYILFITSICKNTYYKTVEIINNITYRKLKNEPKNMVHNYAVDGSRVVIVIADI